MNELFRMMMLPAVAQLLKENKAETIDLTTKEGHDKAIEVLNESLNNGFTKAFFGENLINELIEKVDNTYNEANKEAGIQEVEPVQPSTLCTDKQKSQINDLVDEYVDTIIQPLGKFEPNIIESVKHSLFEFACWIMNR